MEVEKGQYQNERDLMMAMVVLMMTMVMITNIYWEPEVVLSTLNLGNHCDKALWLLNPDSWNGVKRKTSQSWIPDF